MKGIKKNRPPVTERVKSQGGSVRHSDYSQEYCIANLKVAREVNLKSCHQKKKFLVTLCGDRQR